MPRNFYSFARLISDALGELGYNVTEANEEYPENPLGKAMAKLDLPIARAITRRVINKRYLGGRKWDLVVIIKGRGVGRKLVADLKRHADRVVGYHFDALSYDPATRRWGAVVDRVSTFDFRDAREMGWPLVELFSAEPPPREGLPITIRISAIMRNHSERLEYVDRVLSELGTEDFFVYVYEQDLRSLAVNFLRQPRLYWKWRHHIHRTPMPYERYRQVLTQSDFTIDYAHPKQTGLTMRTFEARASGAKLITNNSGVNESPFIDQNQAVVFRRGDDPRELRRSVAAKVGVRPPMRWRSAVDCMREIIGEEAARC